MAQSRKLSSQSKFEQPATLRITSQHTTSTCQDGTEEAYVGLEALVYLLQIVSSSSILADAGVALRYGPHFRWSAVFNCLRQLDTPTMLCQLDLDFTVKSCCAMAGALRFES